MTVHVIGSLSQDSIVRVKNLPARNEEAFCIERIECHGGGGANAAVYIRSVFGLETSLISCVGADREGEYLLEKVREAGVTTGRISLINKKLSTRHIILVDGDENRMTVVLSGAMEEFSPTFLDQELLEHGKSFVISPLRPDSAIDVLRVLKPFEFKLFWNPGSSLYGIQNLFFELVSHVHCLILNEEESLRYCGCEDVFQAAKRLMRMGLDILTITLGSKGALAFQGENYFYTPAVDVKTVTTVGCGDAFSAGFAGAVIMGCSPKEALMVGNELGAFVATQPAIRDVLPSEEQLKDIRNRRLTKPNKAYLASRYFNRKPLGKFKEFFELKRGYASEDF